MPRVKETPAPVPASTLVRHPLAEVLPPADAETINVLVADIKERGLIHPIVRYQDQILDGFARWQACVRAGVEPRFTDYEGTDPEGYVVAANVHRRHLTSEQKRAIIGKLVKANPARSDSSIAKVAGASDKTVAAVRKELAERSEIPSVATRIDSLGRAQPASQPRGGNDNTAGAGSPPASPGGPGLGGDDQAARRRAAPLQVEKNKKDRTAGLIAGHKFPEQSAEYRQAFIVAVDLIELYRSAPVSMLAPFIDDLLADDEARAVIEQALASKSAA
jgi:hypothetical protein